MHVPTWVAPFIKFTVPVAGAGKPPAVSVTLLP